MIRKFPMSYYLIVTALAAIIAIIYIWYKTKYLNYIPDDVILEMDGTDAPLLSRFFESHLKPEIVFDINEEQVASELLNKLYKEEIDAELLVVGEDVNIMYTILTGEILDIKDFYDVRTSIGLNMGVAVVTDPVVRKQLKQRVNVSCIPEVSELMKLELENITKDYLTQILEYRWNKLNELNHDNVINTEGSYVYLKEELDNVKMDEKYKRVNLLCTDAEFETFLKRLTNKESISSTLGLGL